MAMEESDVKKKEKKITLADNVKNCEKRKTEGKKW